MLVLLLLILFFQVHLVLIRGGGKVYKISAGKVPNAPTVTCTFMKHLIFNTP